MISNLTKLYDEFNPKEWLWLISYSGGKDSTLLLITTLEFAESKGFNVHVVYNDCGGDLPELRELAYKVLEYVKLRGHVVHITKPHMTFFDYLLTKYSPPRWNFRWCCKRVKEYPFKELVRKLSSETPILNLLGLRREEARWRNWFLKRISDRLVYASPLNNLKTREIWELLKKLCERNNFWSSVYVKLRIVYGTAHRSGCWFCPLIIHDRLLSSKPELLQLKLEILDSWCNGNRKKIIDLARQYPHLIKVTIDSKNIRRGYPCGRKCSKCQVFITRHILRELVKRN